MPLIYRTAKSLTKAIEGEVYQKLSDLLKRGSFIESRIKNFTREYLKNTETYQAIAGGELVGEFGFPYDGSERADIIVETFVEGIHLNSRGWVSRNRPTGSFSISLDKSIYDELKSLDAANVETEKGQVLPWLEWLLERGDEIIITDFRIKFGPWGRSGQAVMIPRGTWKVPSEYSGTEDNNWLTRAVRDYDSYILSLKEILNQSLSGQ